MNVGTRTKSMLPPRRSPTSLLRTGCTVRGGCIDLAVNSVYLLLPFSYHLGTAEAFPHPGKSESAGPDGWHWGPARPCRIGGTVRGRMGGWQLGASGLGVARIGAVDWWHADRSWGLWGRGAAWAARIRAAGSQTASELCCLLLAAVCCSLFSSDPARHATPS